MPNFMPTSSFAMQPIWSRETHYANILYRGADITRPVQSENAVLVSECLRPTLAARGARTRNAAAGRVIA
jgi:hypothetical protein